MNIRKLFALVAGRAAHIEDHKSPGPLRDAPSVQAEDIPIIATSAALSKWADVVYCGPGAQAAEERRAAALGRARPSTTPPPTTTPDAESPEVKTPEPPRSSHGRPKKKRAKLSMRERLARLRQNGGA